MGLFSKKKKDKEDSAEALKGSALALALGVPLAGKPSTPPEAAFKPYFELFGINGTGFLQASDIHPQAVVQILESAREALKLCDYARASRHNCSVLCEFLGDVVALLDSHGARFAALEAGKADQLAEAFMRAATLVGSASADGWLLQMAFAAAPKSEAFQELHSTISQLMQLKRLLRQLGAGAVVAGLQRLQVEERSLNEVAQILEVPPQDILFELEACPDLEAAAASTGSTAGVLYEGPIRDHECAAAFCSYAAAGAPVVDKAGFANMLEDFGAMDLSDQVEQEKLLERQFSKADLNNDGVLDFPEFSMFYLGQQLSLHRQHLRAELGLDAERKLRAMVSAFARFGNSGYANSLDSFRFSKLCKESGLATALGEAGSGLASNQVDLVFTKAKPRDGRRLDFDGCVAALALIAQQTGQSLTEVVGMVLDTGGPAVNVPQAEATRLHDDKSTWTGVYARGGMSVVDRTLDPAAAIVSRDSPTHSSSLSINVNRAQRARTTPTSSAASTPTAAAVAALRRSTAGSGLRLPLQKLQQQGDSFAVPMSARAPNTARKGASSGNGKAAATLTPTPDLTPRNKTATAGVKPSARTPSVSRQSSQQQAVVSHPVTPSAFVPSGPAGEDFACAATPAAPSEVYDTSLRRVFLEYATFGTRDANQGEAGLDGARFSKLCRETGLLNKALTATRVDLIFARSSGKARRIRYEQFSQVLEALAEARGSSTLDVKRAVAASEGPQCRGTTTQPLRLSSSGARTSAGSESRPGSSLAEELAA
ncbi:hypothetical protein N2152v2_006779 [Parachlorella kessleri]